jgi:tRNA(Ile)-lysidine synthase
MENLLSTFQDTLQRLHVAKKDRLLLAVSGGLDSVVLMALAAMSELDFGIAHANFQMRGSESERDEAFVRELSVKYGKEFFTRQFDTVRFAESQKLSIQVAARDLRYQWFKTFIGESPSQFQFLLTAHHLDDNIETMLMHFFRGTGITGMSGMPEKNNHLIRPLLTVSRDQIKDFAISRDLRWVEDSSNNTDDYTRNYLRNQLVPALTTFFPGVLQNMKNNLFRFSETALIYQQAVREYKKNLLKASGAEFHIPILLLKKVVPLRTILYEIIKDFHFSAAQTDDAIRLMDSTNGKYISSSTSRIIKNRRWLIIAPLEESNPSHIIIEENTAVVNYPEGQIRLRKITAKDSGTLSKDPSEAWLDAEKIQFPLVLRKWKTGDYFYPLGMKKKKKLARFLIDQKLSKTAKEKIWVLVMDSQIIWVLGQRIDNRFCIRVNTPEMLLIKNADA